MAKKEQNDIQPVSLDVMACVGKKITLAGKEYKVSPVNIRDMHLILNAGELYIPISSEEKEEKAVLQLVGVNVTDAEKAQNLFYVIEKYVRYKDEPMTKKMVEEHNWSFADIKEFLLFWAQIVSD